MKRLCWMGWIGTVLLGIGLHALYAWRPIPLLGLFSPVNESVWEHLKLLYWPFLAVCGLLSPRVPSLPAFWGAACSSLLTMPPVLMGIWYTAHCGFGAGTDCIIWRHLFDPLHFGAQNGRAPAGAESSVDLGGLIHGLPALGDFRHDFSAGSHHNGLGDLVPGPAGADNRLNFWR